MHVSGFEVGLLVVVLPLVAAAQNIVPVAKTSAEAVDKLRNWASGRCLSADEPGIYQYGKFGVRLEDIMVITESGAELLTPQAKSLAIADI